MKRYKLELIRVPCIYCGACEKLGSEHWVLNSKGDLKADIINGKVDKQSNNLILKESLEINDLGGNINIAKACPMNIIHVYDQKKQIKLI